MTRADVMKRLEAWGDPRVRAVNARHGAGENQFGIILSKLRGLAKELKTDHPLALELWATGNAEAMLLATLLMKPKELSADAMDAMMRRVTYSKVADWFVTNVVRKTRHAKELRALWRDAAEECAARAGWNLLAEEVKSDPSLAVEALDKIEAEMKQAPAKKQETMNYCLAMIGISHPEYRERAIGIGHRLEVMKDYPVPKGCISPFAPIWITAMVERNKA